MSFLPAIIKMRLTSIANSKVVEFLYCQIDHTRDYFDAYFFSQSNLKIQPLFFHRYCGCLYLNSSFARIFCKKKKYVDYLRCHLQIPAFLSLLKKFHICGGAATVIAVFPLFSPLCSYSSTFDHFGVVYF